MKTGKLTPRSNDTIESRRYTGGFGQPNGFGSVLQVGVRRDGRLVLTLNFKADIHGDGEQMWSVELDNEQRNDLVKWVGEYQPTLVEVIEKNNG